MNLNSCNITYEPMQKQHVSEVAQIESTVHDGWSEDVLIATLKFAQNKCFVALHSGKVCAFCAFSCVQNVANIDAVSTAEQFRRKGIASGLLNYAFKYVANIGVNTFWLEVRSKNTSAINLYKTLGFTQNGMRKCFYTNPVDDAILMQKMI